MLIVFCNIQGGITIIIAGIEVEPGDFTSDLTNRLRALYAQ